MSSDAGSTRVAPLDLSKWRNAPLKCIAIGGIGALIAAVVNTQSFAFSWLFAYMFFLSLCLGCWFLSWRIIFLTPVGRCPSGASWNTALVFWGRR